PGPAVASPPMPGGGVSLAAEPTPASPLLGTGSVLAAGSVQYVPVPVVTVPAQRRMPQGPDATPQPPQPAGETNAFLPPAAPAASPQEPQDEGNAFTPAAPPLPPATATNGFGPGGQPLPAMPVPR